MAKLSGPFEVVRDAAAKVDARLQVQLQPLSDRYLVSGVVRGSEKPQCSRSAMEVVRCDPKAIGAALGAIAERIKADRAEESCASAAQLEDDEILAVLRTHQADVKNCLAKHAESAESVPGTMTVALVILPSGATRQVSVSSAFEKSIAGRCIVEAVQQWTFPKFSGAPMPVDFPVPVHKR